MEIEMINKLFLELGQFATAETSKEKTYKAALERIRDHRFPSDPIHTASSMRDIARDALKRAQYR